ncbi:MAG: DnaJ family domain-containing protein [Pseudomonadota bacterium]
MIAFQKISEHRIMEAQQRGVFDNLPGAGKPLEFEDDSHIPEDLRMAYKILKNAQCLPPEIELKKEIKQMEDLLATMPDTEEKYRKMKKLNFLIMKLNETRKVSPLLEEPQHYEKKLVERLTTKGKGQKA